MSALTTAATLHRVDRGPVRCPRGVLGWHDWQVSHRLSEPEDVVLTCTRCTAQRSEPGETLDAVVDAA